MKTRYIFAIVFLFIIVGSVFAFLPTWDWFFNFFKEKEATISQLLITTPKSSAKVYLDGESRGTTEADKEFTITGIKKGSHKIEILREASADKYYQKFEKTLDFVPGTAVQINWSAGPTIESSSGVIKYFKKQALTSSPTLKVSIYPDNSLITLDENKADTNTVIKDTKKHTLSVSKQNYITQDISIQMTKSNGDQIKDYDLIVEVYLFQIPLVNT